MADMADSSGSGIKPEWNTVELPPSIEIKESSVKKGEAGAFAKTLITEDTRFGPYKGEIIMAGQKDFIDYRYAWEVYEKDTDDLKHTISAINPKTSNWMRHVNCARFYEEQNILSIQDGYSIFYVAMKDIEAGEELLTWFDPKLIKRTKRRLSKMARKPVGYTIELVPWDDEKKFVPEIIETKRARKKKMMSEDMIALDEDPLALTRTLQRLSKIPCTPKQLALSSSYRGMPEIKNKNFGSIKIASLVNASALSKAKKESNHKTPFNIKSQAEAFRMKGSVIKKHDTKITYQNFHGEKDQSKKVSSSKFGLQKPSAIAGKGNSMFCSKNVTESTLSSVKNKGMKNVTCGGVSPVKFVTTRVQNSTNGEIVHEEVISVKPIIIKQSEDGRTTVEDHDETFLLDNLQLEPQCDETCPCLVIKKPVGSSEEQKQEGFVIHFTLLPEHKKVSCDNQIIYRCDVCDNFYNHAFSLKRHYLGVHVNHRYLSREDIVNCQIETFHTGTHYYDMDTRSDSSSLSNEKPSFVTKYLSNSTTQVKNINQISTRPSLIFINKLPGNTNSNKTQNLNFEETLSYNNQDKTCMKEVFPTLPSLASLAQMEVDKLSQGVPLCSSLDSQIATYGSFNSGKLSDAIENKDHHTNGVSLHCYESLSTDLLISDRSDINCDASTKTDELSEKAEVSQGNDAAVDETGNVLQPEVECLTSVVASCGEDITQDRPLLLNDITMSEADISIREDTLKQAAQCKDTVKTPATSDNNQISVNVFDLNLDPSKDCNAHDNQPTAETYVNSTSSVRLFPQSTSVCSLANQDDFTAFHHNLLVEQSAENQEKHHQSCEEHTLLSLQENIFVDASEKNIASSLSPWNDCTSLRFSSSTVVAGSCENMQADSNSCGLSLMDNSDVIVSDDSVQEKMTECASCNEAGQLPVSDLNSNVSSHVGLGDIKDIQAGEHVHTLSEFVKCDLGGILTETVHLNNDFDMAATKEVGTPACSASHSGDQCSQACNVEPTVWDFIDKKDPNHLLLPGVGEAIFSDSGNETSTTCRNVDSLSNSCGVLGNEGVLGNPESAVFVSSVIDNEISAQRHNMEASINSCKAEEEKGKATNELPDNSDVSQPGDDETSAVFSNVCGLFNSGTEKEEGSSDDLTISLHGQSSSSLTSSSIHDSETSAHSKHILASDSCEKQENNLNFHDNDTSVYEKSQVTIPSIIDSEIPAEGTVVESCQDQKGSESSAEQSALLLPNISDNKTLVPCNNEQTSTDSYQTQENDNITEEAALCFPELSTLPLSTISDEDISIASEKSVVPQTNVVSTLIQEMPSSSAAPAVTNNQSPQPMIFVTNIVFPVVSSTHSQLGNSASHPPATTTAPSSSKTLPVHTAGVPLVVISRVPCGVNIQNSANTFLQSPATLKAIETIKNSIGVLNLGTASKGASLSVLPSDKIPPSSVSTCGDTPLSVTTALMSPSAATSTSSPSTSTSSPSTAALTSPTFILSPSAATTTLISPKGSTSKTDPTKVQPQKPVSVLSPPPFTAGPSFLLISNKVPVQNSIASKAFTPSTTSSVSPKKSCTAHLDQPDDLYRCHMCVLVFKTMNELKQHIRNDPHRFKGGLKQYGCLQCSMRFSNKNNLTRHNLMNHPENENYKYRCFTCGKGFMSETYLKMHARFHTGKNFPCKYGCNDVFFPNAASLVKHLRTHHAGLDLKEYLRNVKFEKGRRKSSIYMIKTNDEQVLGQGMKDKPETSVISSSPSSFIQSGIGFLAKRGHPKGPTGTFKDVKLVFPQTENQFIKTEEPEQITDSNESETCGVRKFRFECALCFKGFDSHLKLLQHRTHKHGAEQSVQEYLYEMSRENVDDEISEQDLVKLEFSPPPSPTTFFNNVNKRGFENIKHFIDGNLESLRLRKKNFAVEDEPLQLTGPLQKVEWTMYNFPPCFEYKEDGTTFYYNTTSPESSQLQISSDAKDMEVDKETSQSKLCGNVKDAEVNTGPILTQNVSDIKSENVPKTPCDISGHIESVGEVLTEAENTNSFLSEEKDLSSNPNTSSLGECEAGLCINSELRQGLLKSCQHEEEKEQKQNFANAVAIDNFSKESGRDDLCDVEDSTDNSAKSSRDNIGDKCDVDKCVVKNDKFVEKNDMCHLDDQCEKDSDNKKEKRFCCEKDDVYVHCDKGDKIDIHDAGSGYEIDNCDDTDIHDQIYSHKRKQTVNEASSPARNLNVQENMKSQAFGNDISLEACLTRKEHEQFIRSIVNDIVCCAGQGENEVQPFFDGHHSSYAESNNIKEVQNDFNSMEEINEDGVDSPNMVNVKVKDLSKEDEAVELHSITGDKIRNMRDLTLEETQKMLKTQLIQALNLEVLLPARCHSFPRCGSITVSGFKPQSSNTLLNALDLAFKGNPVTSKMIRDNVYPSFKEVTGDRALSPEPSAVVAQSDQSYSQGDPNSDTLRHDHRRYHIWAGQSHDKFDSSSKENSFCQPVTEAVKKQAMMQQMADYQCDKLKRDKEIEEVNNKISKQISFAEKLGLMTSKEFELSYHTQKDPEFVIKVPEIWDRYENIWFGKKGNIAVVCSVCHRHFSCWDLCLRHQLKKHPHIEPSSLEMEKDNFVEDMFYYYPMPYGILAQTHLIPDNLPTPEVYVCTRCGFPFKNLNRLHAHMIICDPAQEVVTGRQINNQRKPLFMTKKLPMGDRQLSRNLEQPKVKGQSNKHDNEVKATKSSNENITKSSKATSKSKTSVSTSQNKSNISDPFSFYSGRTQRSYEILYNPQNHTRRREQYKVLDQHQCHGCNLKFESLLVLERHVNKCSGRDKLQNQKPLLSGIMPDDAALKKQHTCRYCNKRFTYFKGVDLHYKRVCAVRKVKEEENKLTEEDLAHEMELKRILEHIKWSKSLSKDSNDIIQGRVKVEEDGTLTPIVKQPVVTEDLKKTTKKKGSKWTSLKRHHPDDDDDDVSCGSSASNSSVVSTKHLTDESDKKVTEETTGQKRLTRNKSQESIEQSTRTKKQKTSTHSSPAKVIKIISKATSPNKNNKNGSTGKHCNNKKGKVDKKMSGEKLNSSGIKQKKASPNIANDKKVSTNGGSASSTSLPKLGQGAVADNVGIKPPARKRGRPERFDPSDMESSYKKKKKSDEGFTGSHKYPESNKSQLNGRKVNSGEVSLAGTSQMRQKTGISVKRSSESKSQVTNKKSQIANIFNNSISSSKTGERETKNNFESDKLLAKMKELKMAAKAESQGRKSLPSITSGKMTGSKDEILSYSQKRGDSEGQKDKIDGKNVNQVSTSLELIKHLTKEEVSLGKHSPKSVHEGKRRASASFLPVATSVSGPAPAKNIKITSLSTSSKTATITTEKVTVASVSSRNSSPVTSGVKTISKATVAKGTLKQEAESKDIKKQDPVLSPTNPTSSSQTSLSENGLTNTAKPCNLGVKGSLLKSTKQPPVSVRVVSLSPNGTSLITHDDSANIPRPAVVFSKSPQVTKSLSSPTQNMINTLSPEPFQPPTKSSVSHLQPKELQKCFPDEWHTKLTTEMQEISSINQKTPAQTITKLATAGSDIITEKSLGSNNGQLSQKSVAYQIKVLDKSGVHGLTGNSDCGKNVIVRTLKGTEKQMFSVNKSKTCQIELVIPEELQMVASESQGGIKQGDTELDSLGSPLARNAGQIILDSTENSKKASGGMVVPDSSKSLKLSPSGHTGPDVVVKPVVSSMESGVTVLCTASRPGNVRTSSTVPKQSLLASSSSQTATSHPQPPGQIIQTIPSVAHTVNPSKPKPTNIILVHTPISAARHAAKSLPLTGSHKTVVPSTSVTAQVDIPGASKITSPAKLGSPGKLVSLSGTIIPSLVQTSAGQKTSGRVIKIANVGTLNSTSVSSQPQKVQVKRVPATPCIVPAIVSPRQPIILTAGQVPKLVTPGIFIQRPSVQQPVSTQGAFTQSLLHTSPCLTKLFSPPAVKKQSTNTNTQQLPFPPLNVVSKKVVPPQPLNITTTARNLNTVQTNETPKQSFVTVSPNTIANNQIMITLEDGTTALLDPDSLAQFLSVSPSLTKSDPISVACLPSLTPDPMNPMVVSIPETPTQGQVDEINWPANGSVDLTQSPDGYDFI